MKYISTRGGIDPVSFNQAVMMGLASDGGLLLPESIPVFSTSEIAALTDLSYTELAMAIFSRFIGDDIPAPTLSALIEASYATFSHKKVVPLQKVDDIYIHELFHGPTFAFKDVALQFLGNLFEYLLLREKSKLNIIGATSGDTGSAAIHGVRGKENINIFILYPHGKVSPVQEKQMTSVLDDNVFNLAIKGNFDDGQRIVKELFADLEFKHSFHLGAVNSINWARIMAQIVYYFSAFSQLPPEARKDFTVVVPTGNFGNIFAGWMAKKMGLPIKKLLLATNANDILHRFIRSGIYQRATVTPTLSPSMDIQLASNFERYLYYLNDCNAAKLKEMMAEFTTSGEIKVSAALSAETARDFSSCRVDDQAILSTIKDTWDKTGYTLDPHSATGVRAARELQRRNSVTSSIVCLATAHPAKFPDAVKEAIGVFPAAPPEIAALAELPCRFELVEAQTTAVKNYVTEKLSER
ncbi:MAG: threonine synthase [Deltaproteobacteria bacterium]|nr:threonine synthase [Deltaproteobacteria bacterium]